MKKKKHPEIKVIPKIQPRDMSSLIERFLKERGIQEPSKSCVMGYNSIMQNVVATKPYDIDFNIAIIGGRRKGKSNLAMFLLEMSEWILGKIDAEYDTYMMVRQDPESVGAILDAIQKNAHRYSKDKYLLLSIDEAGKWAGKRDAMSRKNREYTKLVQIIGALNSTLFYIAPKIDDIDSRICDPDILHVLLLVTRRGKAWVYSSRITSWLNLKSSIQHILRNRKEFDFITSFVSCGTGRLYKKFPPLAAIDVPRAKRYASYRHDRVELVKQQVKSVKDTLQQD